MGDKPQVSARHTYVLDPAEVEQLDDLSLTSIIGDAARSLPSPEEEREQKPPKTETAPTLGDETINELLRETGEPSPNSRSSGPQIPEHVEQPDELLAPDLLFGDDD